MIQYFAQVNENNIVTDIKVVSKEFLEANPERYPGRWVETFYNDPEHTYAGIGDIYNEITEEFEPAPEEES